MMRIFFLAVVLPSLALAEAKHKQVDMFKSRDEYRSRMRGIDLSASPGELEGEGGVVDLRSQGGSSTPPDNTPPKSGVMVGIGDGNAQLRDGKLIPADGVVRNKNEVGTILSISDSNGKVIAPDSWNKFIASGEKGKVVYEQDGQQVVKPIGQSNGPDAC